MSQSGTTPFTATTSAVGFDSPTTAGNLLVCVTYCYNHATAGNSADGVSWGPSNLSTAGVTWTQVRNPFGYNDVYPFPLNQGAIGIFYIPNAPSISPATLTTFSLVQNNGGPHIFTTNLEFELYEFADIIPTSPVDAFVIGNLTYPSSPNGTPGGGNIVATGVDDLIFVSYSGKPGSNIAAGSGYTLGINASLAVVGQTQYMLDAPPGTYPTAFSGTVPLFALLAVAFKGVAAPPPPPPTCVPVGINGVYVPDLSLFIGPATALYANPVPTAQIAVNESNTQGRNAIILDFNNSEGLYARDLGVVFSWPISSKTVLDLWQPTIIPEQDDLYNRLSYHFLINALGLTGWGHIRELNIAHNATANINLLLQFDQWPDINITIPHSGGLTTKVKVVLPAQKFKMVEGFLSSSQPFMLWGESCELKLGQWGRAEGYKVLKPFSG